MGIELSSAVLRHLSRVRENPARAVDPAELEELERFVREDRTRSFVARMSPEAPYTWTSRVELDTTADESQVDTIEDFGSPVTIVGLLPTLLKLESAKTLPPIEGIDVQINIDRGARSFITAANTQPNSQEPRPQYAPLSSVSAIVANRLLDLELGLNDQVPTMAFTYRWTVDAATRTALGWSNVQVSMAILYKLTDNTSRRRPGGK
jgi:hypothetical protein